MDERAFVFHRRVDVSGVSGTGLVAHGMRHADGSATVWWLGKHPTETKHRDMVSVLAIHGHGGKTAVLWCDRHHDEWTVPWGDGRFIWIDDRHRVVELKALLDGDTAIVANDDRDRANLEHWLRGESGFKLGTMSELEAVERKASTIVWVGTIYTLSPLDKYLREGGRVHVLPHGYADPSLPTGNAGWIYQADGSTTMRWNSDLWDRYEPRIVDGDHICAVEGPDGSQFWIDGGPGEDRITLLQLLAGASKVWVSRRLLETGGDPAAVKIALR